MKQHYLYKITNKENGMIYVGIRTTSKEIDKDHKYMGSGIRIKNAIEKHGLELFEKTILATFDTREELMAAEKKMVNKEFVLRSDTYNIAIGGHDGDTWTAQTDPEKKARHKIAVGIAMKRPEVRKRVSDAQSKFLKNNPERLKQMTEISKQWFDDNKEKFIEQCKNRVYREGWKETCTASKQTPEHKQKRSDIANNWPIFECEICGKFIKSKGNFTQHMNKHKRNGDL